MLSHSPGNQELNGKSGSTINM